AFALKMGPTPSNSTRPTFAGVHSVINNSRPGDTPPKALLGKFGMICKKGCEISAEIVALPPAGCQLVSTSGLSGMLGVLLFELFESSESPQALNSNAILKLSKLLRMMVEDMDDDWLDVADVDRKNMV
ncbi:hypothetical protein, partial [Psychrobacter sp.]|uniref:hypothetical protein n=1 Tax=Psychrobacter sp. TaxID=56811 RepID=UPI003F9E70D0